MSGFQCPYCSMVMALNSSTHSRHTTEFESHYTTQIFPSTLIVDFYKCPNCGEYTIQVCGHGKAVSDIPSTLIRPNSLANQYPEYIPLAIRNDYEEACAIMTLSPKSSATLARRCLQGMIRDFWEIKKNRLVDEIDELKDKVPAQQWTVIDGVRRIGNIGAHMEKDINTIVDIDPGEAQKLIKLIELLIEQWYINRHEQEQLYADILDIDKAKQEDRNTTR